MEGQLQRLEGDESSVGAPDEGRLGRRRHLDAARLPGPPFEGHGGTEGRWQRKLNPVQEVHVGRVDTKPSRLSKEIGRWGGGPGRGVGGAGRSLERILYAHRERFPFEKRRRY